MQTRYDLNLVLYSLERRDLHPDIRDSNLGDNVAFLMEHLENEDLARACGAMSRIPDSAGSLDVGEKHLEIGHYIQAARDFGPIRAGTYGVISAISPCPHGLFLVKGVDSLLMEAQFDPRDVSTIFGTYVI
jgi:hypothetical protein